MKNLETLSKNGQVYTCIINRDEAKIKNKKLDMEFSITDRRTITMLRDELQSTNPDWLTDDVLYSFIQSMRA